MTSTSSQSADEPPWMIFGETSRVRFIEPYFCHWVLGRALKEDELSAAMREIQKFAAAHPTTLVLCNLSELSGMSPQLRKTARENSRDIETSAVAFVGASFQAQVTMTLLIKAVRFFKGKKPMPFVFVSSEDEGFRFLEKQAEELKR